MMTRRDIINLIQQDPWMMGILQEAKDLNLPDWMIGAGFVRNKVWDHLHGFINVKVPTNDIDLVYFYSAHIDKVWDKKLSEKLTQKTGIEWNIVNQAYTHEWHNRPPYKNTLEAISEWVETPTCVAVSLDDHDNLILHAPHGIDDLVNLIVRPSPHQHNDLNYQKRQQEKGWQAKWPKLTILDK